MLRTIWQPGAASHGDNIGLKNFPYFSRLLQSGELADVQELVKKKMKLLVSWIIPLQVLCCLSKMTLTLRQKPAEYTELRLLGYESGPLAWWKLLVEW